MNKYNYRIPVIFQKQYVLKIVSLLYQLPERVHWPSVHPEWASWARACPGPLPGQALISLSLARFSIFPGLLVSWCLLPILTTAYTTVGVASCWGHDYLIIEVCLSPAALQWHNLCTAHTSLAWLTQSCQLPHL